MAAVYVIRPESSITHSPHSKCTGALVPPPTSASTSGSPCTRALCATASSTSTLSTFISPLSDRGEYRYLCRVCGFMAKRRKQALEHQYKHLEKYPYQCNKCDYGTVRSFNLKRHYGRIHSIVATDVSDDENAVEVESGERVSNLRQVEYHPLHHASQQQQTIDTQPQLQAQLQQRTQGPRLSEQQQQQQQQQAQPEAQHQQQQQAPPSQYHCEQLEDQSEKERDHHHHHKQQQQQRLLQRVPQLRQQDSPSELGESVNSDGSALTMVCCTAAATGADGSSTDSSGQTSSIDNRCVICTAASTSSAGPAGRTQSVVPARLDTSGRCRSSPQVAISLAAGTVATVTTTTRIGIVAQQSQILTSTPVSAFGPPPTIKRPLLVAVPGVGTVASSLDGMTTNLSSAIPFAAQALQELSRAPRVGVITQPLQKQELQSQQVLLTQPVGHNQTSSSTVSEYRHPLWNTPTVLRTVTPVEYRSAAITDRSFENDSLLCPSHMEEPPETEGPEEVVIEHQQLSPISSACSRKIRASSTGSDVSEFTPRSTNESVDESSTVIRQRLRSTSPPEESEEQFSPPTGAGRRKFRLPYQLPAPAVAAAAGGSSSAGCDPCCSSASPDLPSRNLRTAVFKANRSIRRHAMRQAESTEPREKRIKSIRNRRKGNKRSTTGARAGADGSSSCSDSDDTMPREHETNSDSDCLIIEETGSDIDDRSQ